MSFLGFLLRALVPVGFMPAALADGGPIKICHGGPAGAFFRTLAESQPASMARAAPRGHGLEHAHADSDSSDRRDDRSDRRGDHSADHSDDHSVDHDGWERCEVGTAFAQAALDTEFNLEVLDLDHVAGRGDSASRTPSISPGTYWARAPPDTHR